jgi:hypothetical protein
VFDHQHRVAEIDEPAENDEQLADVVEVQAGGRFVEDVDGFAWWTTGRASCSRGRLPASC